MSDTRQVVYAITGHGDIELHSRAHDALRRAVELVDAGDALEVRVWEQYAPGAQWREVGL